MEFGIEKCANNENQKKQIIEGIEVQTQERI